MNSLAPRSDGSPQPTRDAGRKDGSTKRDAGRKDASLDGRAPPAFGFAARPANASCLAPKRPTNEISVALQRLWPTVTFTQPVAILQAPNDKSHLFILAKRGVVRIVDSAPDATVPGLFLDIQTRVNGVPPEAGLLGMAFDPDFATTGVVYISYTGHSSVGVGLTSHLSRFRSSDGGKTLDPASEEILFSVEQPYANHNGGNIQFGPDGFLYLGLGDGGSGGDPLNNAQNRDVFLGKMLRFGVSTTGPYTIPPTNPFAAGGGKPEIFALGLRNPWRWSFDRATGDLWVGDVGQGQREEIDKLERGGNYGWRLREGTLCNPCGPGPYIEPIIDYPRSVGNCVVGGFVYHGTAIPQLVGTYVYADYPSGTIFRLVYDQKTGAPITPPVQLIRAPGPISSFGEGDDGELYVALYSAGAIVKVVPGAVEAGSNSASLPPALSASGCVDADDPTKFASGVIPYDVNIAYWADGTEMKRGFAIPDGTTIKVLPDGHFDFPNGSVLVQTASKDGRRLHTRFLVRHDDGDWGGYAYEWNQAQTDATLIHGAKLVKDGSFSSYVTNSAGCLTCHTSGAGRVLGLHSRQINRDFSYANGARLNQLTQLEHIGLFDSALPASAKASPYPAVDGTAPVDARARAYLDVNCSMCHRPGGADSGVPDLRIGTPIEDAALCNVPPTHGRIDVPSRTLLTPGSPDLSLLSLRMHSDDWSRMPPLESLEVDSKGAALIDEWITSVDKCPVSREAGGG